MDSGKRSRSLKKIKGTQRRERQGKTKRLLKKIKGKWEKARTFRKGKGRTRSLKDNTNRQH
jgi:hypothetical protein